MIEVEGLRKRFRTRRGPVEAVAGIDFRVEAGEFVGYAGPNGAGKSTTVKMMSGILLPSGGRVVVDGLVPYQQRKRLARRIGVVFGQRSQLWWDLPLADSFDLVRHLYRLPAASWRRRLDELTGLLDLGPLLPRRCGPFPWASGCAPSWPPRCCQPPASCSWTSRPSAWTSRPRPPCAASSATSTRPTAPPSS